MPAQIWRMLAALVLLALPGQVAAAPQSPVEPPAAAPAETLASLAGRGPDPAAVAAAGLAATLSESELLGVTSGALNVAAILTQQSVTGSVNGASIQADSVQNGDIILSGDALSNFSGIGNFVLNTGNNSTLQGVVNVTFTTTQ